MLTLIFVSVVWMIVCLIPIGIASMPPNTEADKTIGGLGCLGVMIGFMGVVAGLIWFGVEAINA